MNERIVFPWDATIQIGRKPFIDFSNQVIHEPH